MKCKCGNDVDIKMGSKLISKGCRVLTKIIIIVTAQCENCGAVFQVPIKSNGAIVKKSI